MKRFVVPALMCLAAAASPAHADGSAPPASAPRLRVAIVPGIAVNLDVARVDALAQDLAEALAGMAEKNKTTREALKKFVIG